MRLIVHAPNVHRGGGRTLLLSLLEAVGKRLSSVALLDRRMDIPQRLECELSIIRVAPTIPGRLAGECALRRLAQETDRVLCFGNLPPLFKIRGQVVVFLQNRYLVDPCSLDGFPFSVRARFMVERLWLRSCRAHASRFIVQTKSMQHLVAMALGHAADVMAVLPESSSRQRNRTPEDHDRGERYDFLYVASGEPHKNHLTLLEAWKILATSGCYPSLCLTLGEPDHSDLVRMIDKDKSAYKLNISNVTPVNPFEMRSLYRQARALIYPSLMESFGLPLIEARQAGLPILASELDYVRDVVDPEEVFDPRSPQSIARAVKRFLQVPEAPLPTLPIDAFVDHLVAE